MIFARNRRRLRGGSSMALDAIVRSAVATAKRVVGSLLTTVEHEAWIRASNKYAAPGFDPKVQRQAFVSEEQRMRRLPNGQEVMQRASILFVEALPPNGAAGRNEPIDSRDRITLTSGLTGPILYAGAPIDPTTGRGYFTEVVLG